VTAADVVGSVGVATLLLAFFLNLFGFLGRETRLYQGLNAAGAALAGWASWRIGFWPFVVLEGTWFLVAAFALARRRPG
jgi:hypothetical protein